MSFFQTLKDGVFKRNAIFCIVLGLCPSLAITTSVENALGMGFAVIFVLLCSEIMVSLIRKHTGEDVRLPVFITIIAAFVTIVGFIMKGFFPALNERLGIYLPLIVVNCIILGRAEVFASKNNVMESIADAIGIGTGYTLALLLIGSIREYGYHITNITVMPAGAFLIMGLLMAFFNFIRRKS